MRGQVSCSCRAHSLLGQAGLDAMLGKAANSHGGVSCGGDMQLSVASAWLEGRQAAGDGEGGVQPHVMWVSALRSRVQARCCGCGVPNWLLT